MHKITNNSIFLSFLSKKIPYPLFFQYTFFPVKNTQIKKQLVGKTNFKITKICPLQANLWYQVTSAVQDVRILKFMFQSALLTDRNMQVKSKL